MKIQINENIVFRDIHGSRFLIDITENYSNDTCSLYELNEIGEFIWESINGDRTIYDIAVLLKEAIVDDVDCEIIVDDVSEFIQVLCAQGFAKGV